MKSAEFLHDSYVRQNGRIFPGGVIRIYSDEVQDDGVEGGGLECWSEDLVKFGTDEYCARISRPSADFLVVFNRETGKEVAMIPSNKVHTAMVWMVKVMPGGFLDAIGSMETEYPTIHSGMSNLLLGSLEKAIKGERPALLDNSVFVKVDPSLAGQILIKVEIGECCPDKYIVFTKDGKLIESQQESWLSYAKWDPENDPITNPKARSALLQELESFLD